MSVKTRKLRIMNFFKTLMRIIFWVFLIAVYSSILLVGAYYIPGAYAGPPRQRDFYDYLLLVVPIIHVILTCCAFLNFKFQKWILFLNLGFYILIMSWFIWVLMSNDLNIFIVGLFLIWIKLFLWTFRKWKSLRVKDYK